MSHKSIFSLEICECGSKPLHGYIQKKKGGKIVNEIGPCFSQESIIEMIQIWYTLRIISHEDAIRFTREIQYSVLTTGKKDFEILIERLSKYTQLSDINFYDSLVHNEEDDGITDNTMKSIILNLSISESMSSIEEEFSDLIEHNSIAEA